MPAMFDTLLVLSMRGPSHNNPLYMKGVSQ